MGQMQDICSGSIINYQVKICDGRPLYYNYERIRAFLKTGHLDSRYVDFLAIPLASGRGNNIIWQSTVFLEKPVPLSELKGEEYEQYKSLLEEYCKEYSSFIDRVKTENQDIHWERILKDVLVCGGEKCVYCGEGKIVLAWWGMTLRGNQKVPSGLYIDQGGYSTDIPEKEEKNDVHGKVAEQEVTDENEPGDTEPDGLISEEHFSVEGEQTESPAGGNDSGKPEKNRANNQNGEKVKTHKSRRQLKWKSVLKWLWWLLVVLFLLWLLGLIFRGCGRQGDQVLPPEPGVLVPVDSADIGYDRDSVTHIVSNRLNILLEKEYSLKEFARELKNHYPGEEYSIIYFDTLLNRLQLQLPTSERDRVKEELPGIFPQYNLLIWEETVYENQYIPNDPAFRDQEESWYLKAVKAPQAWDKSQGNEEIVVAVLDNGFDPAHPELADKLYRPYNAVQRNGFLFPAGMQGAGHGTHVAGTAVGAADNYTGICGVAPKCRLMAVQLASWDGIMTNTAIIDATMYAINNGADVINMSFGMNFSPFVLAMPPGMQRDFIMNFFLEEEQLWNKIFQIAEKHGCTIVMAAGNDNVLAGLEPKSRNPLGIKVAAVGQQLRKADFSNYGEYTTVSAPGVKIYNSVPGRNYEYLQGTSMASPIVTGAVALLKSVNKNLTTPEIIRILQTTGIKGNDLIGRVIQLDKALEVALKGEFPPVNSPGDRLPGGEDGTDRPQPGGGLPGIGAPDVGIPGRGEDLSDCDAIALRIEELQREIEQLRNLCPELGSGDTMRYREILDNPSSLNGRWKSTTALHNDEGRSLLLYFDFQDTQGMLSVVEPGDDIYTASLSVLVKPETVSIVQEDKAVNDRGETYCRYSYRVKPDRGGYVECEAQNVAVKANRLKFKLVRIK